MQPQFLADLSGISRQQPDSKNAGQRIDSRDQGAGVEGPCRPAMRRPAVEEGQNERRRRWSGIAQQPVEPVQRPLHHEHIKLPQIAAAFQRQPDPVPIVPCFLQREVVIGECQSADDGRQRRRPAENRKGAKKRRDDRIYRFKAAACAARAARCRNVTPATLPPPPPHATRRYRFEKRMGSKGPLPLGGSRAEPWPYLL